MSSSRRRRIFDFLQQSSPAAASPTSPTTSASPPSASDASALPAVLPAALPSSAEREAARARVAERLALHEEAVRKDAEDKRRRALYEFAQLRTPPKPEPPVVEPVTYPIPAPSTPREPASIRYVPPTNLYGPPSAVERPAIADLSGAYQSVVDAAEATVQSAAGFLENLTDEKGGQDVDEEKVELKVEAFLDQLVEDIKVRAEDNEKGANDRLEDAKEGAEDIVEDIVNCAEDLAEDIKEVPEDTIAKSMPNERAVKENADVEKSLAEKLLEAIVEGVEAPEPAAPVVDKTDLLGLVESGKIKKLTVTKLKRLLSANGLKTSGRKSELIARLTSYANTK